MIRIETTACGDGGVGSGFLIAPDLVATVAHVVMNAQNVILRSSGTSTTGTVVGIDPGHELALVRATRPFEGHVFSLAINDPAVGDDVAAIGYPLGGDESFTKGSISGLHRHLDDLPVDNLMQTDASINPGNSGGPLLDSAGSVVGLVEAKNSQAENIGFAIPATDAASELGDWQSSPHPVHAGSCGTPVGPSGVTASVTDDSSSADGAAIASMFTTYATGINTGHYDAAYAELAPRAQALTSPEQFAAGETSSYLFDIHLTSVTPGADGSDVAEVTFTSVQDAQLGGTGQSCSRWALTYTLAPGGDNGWQIARAQPHSGSPQPC